MIQEETPFSSFGFQPFENGPSIAHLAVGLGAGNLMTLKIERFPARVRLSGELRSKDLDQVKTELDECGASAVLDLEEVSLADVEGVRFLNGCEATGVSVVHCSPYIREWMLRERTERNKYEAEEGENNEIC